MHVSWDHTVDPPVPLVTETVRAADGGPSVVVRDRDESLRLMWAKIERLQAAMVSTAMAGLEAARQERWHGGQGER